MRSADLTRVTIGVDVVREKGTSRTGPSERPSPAGGCAFGRLKRMIRHRLAGLSRLRKLPWIKGSSQAKLREQERRDAPRYNRPCGQVTRLGQGVGTC